MDHLYYFFIVLLCFHVRLIIDAFWSPAGERLTFLLLCVMSNCEAVTFSLVSWVRCGTLLYRFVIFSLFLAFTTALIIDTPGSTPAGVDSKGESSCSVVEGLSVLRWFLICCLVCFPLIVGVL